MRPPMLRLSTFLVLLGWCLVLGAAYEAFELLHDAWTTWRSAHGFILDLVHGPILHAGVALGLWRLAES